MPVFCVHLVIDQHQTVVWFVRAGGMDLPPRIQNHTLLGHSPPDSQAGRRVALAFGLTDIASKYTRFGIYSMNITNGGRKMLKTVGQVDLAAAQPLLWGEIPL
jgi:hypothetical protein